MPTLCATDTFTYSHQPPYHHIRFCCHSVTVVFVQKNVLTSMFTSIYSYMRSNMKADIALLLHGWVGGGGYALKTKTKILNFFENIEGLTPSSPQRTLPLHPCILPCYCWPSFLFFPLSSSLFLFSLKQTFISSTCFQLSLQIKISSTKIVAHKAICLTSLINSTHHGCKRKRAQNWSLL